MCMARPFLHTLILWRPLLVSKEMYDNNVREGEREREREKKRFCDCDCDSWSIHIWFDRSNQQTNKKNIIHSRIWLIFFIMMDWYVLPVQMTICESFSQHLVAISVNNWSLVSNDVKLVRSQASVAMSMHRPRISFRSFGPDQCLIYSLSLSSRFLFVSKYCKLMLIDEEQRRWKTPHFHF